MFRVYALSAALLLAPATSAQVGGASAPDDVVGSDENALGEDVPQEGAHDPDTNGPSAEQDPAAKPDALTTKDKSGVEAVLSPRRKRRRKRGARGKTLTDAEVAERTALFDEAAAARAAQQQTLRLENASWRYEVGASFEYLAASSSIGINTQMLPMGGVHFAMQKEMFLPRLVVGGGARLLYGQQVNGNATVRVGALYLAGVGRGLIGYEMGTKRFAFTPHAFTDVTFGGGPGATKVEADVSYRFLPLAAFHVGAGAEFRVWNIVMGIDCGVGAMNLRLSMSSLMRLGVTF